MGRPRRAGLPALVAGEWRKRLPPEPGLVQDRDELRRVLLAGPWELDTGAARWIAAAGLGLLRNRL